MPNWCNNELTIFFEKESAFNKWLEIFSDDYFAFNQHFLPEEDIPDKYKESYLPLNEYWGTKWEVDSISLEWDRVSKIISLNYLTAWSPNIKVLEKAYEVVCEDDKDIDMTCYYSENGMGFRGVFANGADNCVDCDPLYHLVTDGNATEHSYDCKCGFCSGGLKKGDNDIISLYQKDPSSEKYVNNLLLIKKSIDCISFSKDLTREINYTKHLCFSETFGDDIVVVESDNKLYCDLNYYSIF